MGKVVIVIKGGDMGVWVKIGFVIFWDEIDDLRWIFNNMVEEIVISYVELK